VVQDVQFCENAARVPLLIRAPGVQARAGLRVTQLAEAVDLYRTLADLSGVGVAAVQPSVDGVSLGALVRSASAPPARTIARSQFPRCFSAINATPSPLPTLDRTDCQDIGRGSFDLMGFSIRTDSYRYTECAATRSGGDAALALCGSAANLTQSPVRLRSHGLLLTRWFAPLACRWREWDRTALHGRWQTPPRAVELYRHAATSRLSDPFASVTANVASDPSLAGTVSKLSAALRTTYWCSCPVWKAVHACERKPTARDGTGGAAAALPCLQTAFQHGLLWR
jgi:hypothetical protein